MDYKLNEDFRIRPSTPRTQSVPLEEDDEDTSEIAQVEKLVKHPENQFWNLVKLEI